ncbi:MAG TPA: TonB-dependent receptor [Nevskiaceae bacterium]|nr:TonB-dependent receptor [Nevskiaceae bacterium]
MRRALGSTPCGLVLLLASLQAFAQPEAVVDDAPPADVAEAPSGNADDAAATLDTIVVTGSRIKRPEFAFANPVVSVDAQAITNSGTVNLTDFLKRLPALTGSLDSNDGAGANAFIGGTGLELLNLRNLGVDRTLVLVNGRRHVAGLPGSAAVDVDTIPQALIERIEVSTGGASAIYGADGVSGVVNFILRQDFEGWDAKAQTGISDRGDANTWLASLVGGHNFARGRANLTGAFEYSRSTRLESSDRGFARNAATFRRNAGDRPDDPNIPDRLPYPDVRFNDSSRGGGVDIDFDGFPDYQGDGTPWDTGQFLQRGFSQGGSGTPLTDYAGDLAPREERYTLNTFGSWRFGESSRAYAELKYSRTHAFSLSQPSFDYYLLVEGDNAYLPEAISEAAGGGQVLVNRDNFDLGVRGENIHRDTMRGVIGFDGDVTDSMTYDVSLVYGQTRVRNRALRSRFNDRFSAALDAVVDPDSGEIVCRSNLDPAAAPSNLDWQINVLGGYNAFNPLPGTWAGSFRPGPNSGCLPINLFVDGGVSRAAADWINGTSLATSRIRQTVGQAVFQGRTVNVFAPGAPELGYAFGVERRVEQSEGHPAVEDQAGLTFGNIISPDKGSYGVSEAFLELSVPLLEDRRFADYIGIGGAMRLSDYSTTGDTRTWKYDATWTPVRDVTFRGTRAKATRAPNIGELFDPGGQTFEFVDDPCNVDNRDLGTEFREANCIALLTALGADPDDYTDPNNGGIPGTLKGNRDLEEEDADTRTYGFVLQPRFVPGFSFSIDWYDIRLENAINVPTPQQAAELCVDAPTLDNPFCSLIVRAPGAGNIVDFTEQPVNVASFTTKGYDLNLVYRLDTAKLGAGRNLGAFTFHVVANKLEDLTFINLPGAPADNDERDVGAPEWQGTFNFAWDYDALQVGYTLIYYGETRRFTREEQRGQPDIAEGRYLNFSDAATSDLWIRYRLRKGLSIYGGVNNLTDDRPDVGEVAYPVSAIGRSYFAGLQWEGGPF